MHIAEASAGRPCLARFEWVFVARSVHAHPVRVCERVERCFARPNAPPSGDMLAGKPRIPSRGITWRDVTWRDVTWRDITSRHVTPRDFMSCHVVDIGT